MQENIYLKAIKKDIKEIKKELKETQKGILKFADIQKERNRDYEKTFVMLFDNLKKDRETEKKNRETMLNVLFAITTGQQEQKNKKNLQ